MIILSPLTASKLTIYLSVQNVSVNGAEEELSFVKGNEENSENQDDDSNDQHDIRNTSNRSKQCIDYKSHSNIMSQESEGSQSSKHSEDFEWFKILTFKRHVEDGSCDDEEIHLIPSVPQIGIIIHAHSHSN